MVNANELEEQLGWQLKPEGLCRDDVCVLVPDRAVVESDGLIDAVAVAELLDRPSLVDTESGVAAIGAQRATRRQALDDLVAPDFVLPDLDGTPARALRSPIEETSARRVLELVRMHL